MAAPQPSDAAPKRATTADWIATLAGALGALMATLDISITNAALPQIQGEIGASGTEGTWISTGYLVSEIVVISLTAWLTRVLGLRTLLLGCAILFTIFSMACGFSHDLTSMIIGRVGQGVTGGALIPAAQVIVRTRLPPPDRPLGMTIFGLIVLVGPLLGPVVGGWLTENVNWQWCFFLNLPVSIALVTLLLLGLPHDPMRIDLLAEADWAGIAGLTAFLSCLTIVLEEGQRQRWFESEFIVWLTVAAASGLIVLLISQVFARRPVIKLRLLLNPAYSGVIIVVLTVGAALYSITYVLPQFLSGISGYNADQSGRILFLSGLPAFLLMPALPQLLGRVNPRILVFLGLLAFAASCFLDTHLTAQSAGDDFVWSQLLRGAGMVLSMMPLNQASVNAVEPEDAGDAAGLYNMARNLGGSLGLALLGVVIDRRSRMHSDAIRETVTANASLVQERISGMMGAFLQTGTDAAYARMQALRQLSGQIGQQALVMTYSECFWLLGVALLVAMPLVFVLRTPKAHNPAAAEVH